MKAFIIDFSYQGAAYTGLVTPKSEAGRDGYLVKLESENQEINLDILAIPCENDKTDWCFRETRQEGEYDKDLLLETGEAIEKYLSTTSSL